MAKVKRTPIQDGWTGFAERVLPKGTPKVQRVEMRRAFFCGAMFLFSSMMKVAGSDPDGLLDPGLMETERDLEQMNAIDAELRAFGVSVQQGEG